MNNTTINIKSLLLNAYDALKEKRYAEGKVLLEKILKINPNLFETLFVFDMIFYLNVFNYLTVLQLGKLLYSQPS